MIVYRIAANTPRSRADDRTGAGAARTGGRWNPVGLPVLYCASTLSLAYLETLVHLPLVGLPPANRRRVEVTIPGAIWDHRRNARLDPALPADWDAIPAGAGSVTYGQKWLLAAAEAVLVVPSVVNREEDNVLINPLHPDAAALKVVDCGPLVYDARFFSPPPAATP